MSQIIFQQDWEKLKELAPPSSSFIITDENLEYLYHDEMKPWRSIVVESGEAAKEWEVVDNTIIELLALQADREATIIGLGGGVVTDLAGFIAAIYKRGVRCVLAPTSILGMVDAAIGGKNGINVSEYKNMIGTIRLPDAVFYNIDLLDTLHREQWANGFAEIIKHAFIADHALVDFLLEKDLEYFITNKPATLELIKKNVAIKESFTQADLTEKNKRKMLNFGHTLGHGIEKAYQFPHGHAVALGMIFAAKVSEQLTGFEHTNKLIQILEKYTLTTKFELDTDAVYQKMLVDKKRFAQNIDFILLKDIAQPKIHSLQLSEIQDYLDHLC